MDSFEWNKIFGAILGTALFVVALNILVGGLLAPKKAERPGMEVAVVEAPTHGDGGPVVEAAPDWGTVLPAADLAAGEKVHQRCLQCHDFNKGGPNKIGPNLFGVVGAKHASNPTFAYSAPMKALADKTWGYDELDAFAKSPKNAVPGTKMSFAGLSKVADRINLIAYLRTLSDAPLAIPAPNPAAPAPAEPSGENAGELSSPPPGTPAPEGAPTPAPGAAPAPGTAPAAGAPAAPATPTPTPPAPAQPTPAGGGGH